MGGETETDEFIIDFSGPSRKFLSRRGAPYEVRKAW